MATKKKAQTTAAAPEEQTAETKTTPAATATETPAAPAPETTAATTPAAPAPETTTQATPEQERDEFADITNPCVYCGPSVRGVARQYTTYQGGIPKELKAFIREHPLVRRLIVHPGKFAVVRQRLETPGTAEAIIYKKLKAEL
ncbi:hypothetical protein [uncultured Dysosmobacter sp.]|uniref:hypothetical protein n=1 Tax=uncultured Dysosmobacter sp. TaxID=2591384 RepID=UPI0026084BD3|nr:hypothetical protein [uncultured Dysosmobacter sp.]